MAALFKFVVASTLCTVLLLSVARADEPSSLGQSICPYAADLLALRECLFDTAEAIISEHEVELGDSRSSWWSHYSYSAFRAGDLDRGRRGRERVKDFNELFRLYEAEADSLIQIGDFEAARKLIPSIERATFVLDDEYRAVADILGRTGEVELFEEYVAHHANMGTARGAHAALAMRLTETGDFDSAEEVSRRWLASGLKQEPHYSVWQFAYRDFLEAGRTEIAEAIFETLPPNDKKRLYAERAMELLALGHLEAASNELARADPSANSTSHELVAGIIAAKGGEIHAALTRLTAMAIYWTELFREFARAVVLAEGTDLLRERLGQIRSQEHRIQLLGAFSVVLAQEGYGEIATSVLINARNLAEDLVLTHEDKPLLLPASAEAWVHLIHAYEETGDTVAAEEMVKQLKNIADGSRNAFGLIVGSVGLLYRPKIEKLLKRGQMGEIQALAVNDNWANGVAMGSLAFRGHFREAIQCAERVENPNHKATGLVSIAEYVRIEPKTGTKEPN